MVEALPIPEEVIEYKLGTGRVSLLKITFREIHVLYVAKSRRFINYNATLLFVYFKLNQNNLLSYIS